MSEKKLVVLSNQTQYQAFMEQGQDPAEYKILCDNARFYEGLASKGISYDALDEFLLKDRWNELNEWGITQAFAWADKVRASSLSSHYDFFPVMHHFFSRTLTHIIKNYLYAQWIVEQHQPDTMVIFESRIRRCFPDYSGNVLLNEFLSLAAEEKKIKVLTFTVTEKEALEDLRPNPFFKWRRRIVVLIKKMIQACYGALLKPDKEPSILVKGSLMHLGPVIEKLKKDKCHVVLYDHEFHREQHSFARKHKVPYVIPDSFAKRSFVDHERWRNDFRSFMEAALDLAAKEKVFLFEGYDFSTVIRKNVLEGIENYSETLAVQADHYENIVRAMNIQAILQDEDFSIRGAFLAAFARRRGVQTFCISHANLGVDFEVPTESRNFCQSLTMVHSDYEKLTYEKRGWNADCIRVTGTPRYDRLAAMIPKDSEKPKAKRKIKLLYCATSLWNHSPDQRGFLGCSIVYYGENQKPAIQKLLRAMKGLPIELVVKPHSFESAAGWRQMWSDFSRKENPKAQISFRRHSDDIFKLYKECDAVLLTYSSTVRVESAIVHKPTLFLDMKEVESPDIIEFDQIGLLDRVCSEDEIRERLKSLVETGVFSNGRLSSHDEYHLGRNDGESAERVSQLIQQTMKEFDSERQKKAVLLPEVGHLT